MQLQTIGGVETRLAIDAETLGLMAYGFSPVGFFEIHCENCGTFRVCVRAIGGGFGRRACPICSTPKPRAAYLAVGFSRKVPFYETVYLRNGKLRSSTRVEYAEEFRRRRQAFRAGLGPGHAATVGSR